MGESSPGSAGTTGIIVAVLAVSAVITLVTGSVVHWPIIALSILVGLLAANIIER